ncbi:hypothetical protein GGR54DRAFT_623436 [Hypoxylon sp. NC1633]|nr:hypothetical protein GGR54DRAFT_623436 [Hypoxylon sp. NC1633]
MPSPPPTKHRPVPPSRRRDKPQLSCNLCRRRKVKCDRQQPCRTCSLRGLAMSCTYPPDGTPSRPSDRDSNTVQNRIRELENLVHVLMQRAASKNSTSASSTPHINQASIDDPVPCANAGEPEPAAPASDALSDRGKLTNSPAGLKYVDGAHWTALLESISELKDCLQDPVEQAGQHQIPPHPVPDFDPCPHLLYGRFAQMSKSEILSTFPTRPVVDKLISQFFNQIELAPSIIHSGQFIREYEEFWEDPFATPISWIGQLFAMMCIASLLLSHLNPYPSLVAPNLENAGIVILYRERVVQCLTLGKYTRGGPHILQTLILYIAIEHFLKEDSEFGTQILLGMLVNIAMRMGYHRDPKYFSVISPFDGEMRRRTWATIYQANLIFASQMGLPSMLKDDQIDTEEPHNLLDSDFDEDTTVLPPSRPESELTPVSYIIVRTRIAKLWEESRDMATGTRRHQYEEILAMEQKLLAARESLPPGLKMQPIMQSIVDAPNLIMQRIWLEMCFLRLRIVLHKNYFIASNHYKRYSYSRSVCVKAATKVIEHQHMVFDLVKPDGLLYEARWRLTSVMNNEFLLSTSILCAYLKQVTDNPACAVDGTSTTETNQLLAQSSNCWQQFCATSKNARMAIEAIRLVLKLTETPTASPAATGDDMSPMLAFQDPLLIDLNFPCTLDGFYNGDDSSRGDFLDSAPFTPIDDEWISMFQRVSTRVPN